MRFFSNSDYKHLFLMFMLKNKKWILYLISETNINYIESPSILTPVKFKIKITKYRTCLRNDTLIKHYNNTETPSQY